MSKHKAGLVALTAMGLVVCSMASVEKPSVVRVNPPRLTRGEGKLRVLDVMEGIQPTVEVHVGYNSNINRFMIEWLVGNATTATNAIAVFGVEKFGEPTAQRRPAQWFALYQYTGHDSAVVWMCMDTLTTPGPDDHGQGSQSPYMIDPGDTVHRFQLFVDNVPQVVHYYAQGFDTIRAGGWPSPFETGWSGSVDLQGVSLIDRGAGVDLSVPKMIELHDPTPNPSSGRTSIAFGLPRAAIVKMVIYDVRGAVVRTLISGRREAGVHVASWNGYSDAGGASPPGAYFAKCLVDGKDVGSRRITIIR